MSGSPFRWPMKQVYIKHPCTQDLSSSPTGLFLSFTASRALSWLGRWNSNWILIFLIDKEMKQQMGEQRIHFAQI